MIDDDRIDQLAAQVRRLRWMNYGMATAVVGVVLLLAFALLGVLPQLRAKRIQIVSDEGRAVLTLGSDDAGGTLRLHSAGGGTVVQIATDPTSGRTGVLSILSVVDQELVRLAANDDSAGLVTTYTRFGEPLVQLDANGLGGGLLGICDGTDPQDRIVISASKHAGSVLVMRNSEGQDLVQLTMTTDGGGAISTHNGKGERLVALGATTGGQGTVTTYNGRGQELVDIIATTGGEGAIGVYNGSGHALVAVSTNAGGDGVLTTYNGMGQALVKLTAVDGVGSLGVLNSSGRPAAVLGTAPSGDGLLVVFDGEGNLLGTIP